MSDYDELVKSIKQIAAKSVEASDPAALCFGTVKSANPLSITVEQKFTIDSANLIVPRYLTNHSISVAVNWKTESDTYRHKHTVDGTESTEDSRTYALGIAGTKQMAINNGLKAGDSVILLRQQGGQKYLVIDRVG